MTLYEEDKRETLTHERLHCVAPVSIEKHHRCLSVYRAAWERADVLDLQHAVVLWSVRQRSPCERPEGLRDRGPSIPCIPVNTSRIATIDVDRGKRKIAANSGPIAP